MSDIKSEIRRIRMSRRPGVTQAGTTAVEFAVLSILFFTIIFGIIEVTRLLFVYNTLQEVTRRAAVAAVGVFTQHTAALETV